MVIAEHLRTHGPQVADVTISRGAVQSPTNGECLIEDHGWVEFLFDGDRYLVDFTLHQASEREPIILAKRDDVPLAYSARDVRSLFEVTNPDVLVRYLVLSARMPLVELGSESHHA